MAAEETVSQKQNMLMEWIVVCLVKEDIKEKEIVGKCDGTYSDENINRSLNEMKSIEIVSIFCTSGMELGTYTESFYIRILKSKRKQSEFFFSVLVSVNL